MVYVDINKFINIYDVKRELKSQLKKWMLENPEATHEEINKKIEKIVIRNISISKEYVKKCYIFLVKMDYIDMDSVEESSPLEIVEDYLIHVLQCKKNIILSEIKEENKRG